MEPFASAGKVAADTFWQHLEKVHAGLGKAQLCWGHWRQTSSGTAKIVVGWVKEIPAVLLHWKIELWGAQGVLPTWRKLALWLHSVFLCLEETADIISQLKTHWTCLHASVLSAIPLLWHAKKAMEPTCQAQGLCFHWWKRWFSALSTTQTVFLKPVCLYKSHMKQPKGSYTWALLGADPHAHKWRHREKLFLEREEGQLKFQML